MEGRFGLKAGAVVTFAALIACTSAATTSFAAEPTEVSIPTPQNLEDGRYIVLLDDAPAATYEGGEAGLTATKPAEGDKLDATTDAVVEYSSHLENLQDEVAAEVGATPDANLTITLNAFTANLTASQAKQLAATNGVSAVVPDEILHPTAVPSTEFLGLEGDNGVWETYAGGPEGAGEGVVVGVIDTGIAPENPSFAGEPLGTTSGATPYLEGNTVVFNKADGGQFRSDRVTGDQWNLNDYSTKLIAAHYFSAGAAASGFDFQWDILSPRDGAGHGSHTASTAAGNYNVETTVSGLDFGPISGVAPAAKIASYKTCYEVRTRLSPPTTSVPALTFSPQSTGQRRMALTSSTSPSVAAPQRRCGMRLTRHSSTQQPLVSSFRLRLVTRAPTTSPLTTHRRGTPRWQHRPSRPTREPLLARASKLPALPFRFRRAARLGATQSTLAMSQHRVPRQPTRHSACRTRLTPRW